jgi:glycosyltransferase involved in cell wall biosynthesis
MSSVKRHIAFLLPTLYAGGAERTILKLAGGFCARGYTVDLVLVHRIGQLISEIPPGVNIFDLKAPRRLTSRALTSLPALRSYLRSNQPDILYTGLMTNLVALWAKRLVNVPTRIVVSERNALSVEIKQFPHDLRFRLMPFLVRNFYPWAERIVAVSRAVADDLSQVSGIPREKITVIHNPVMTSSVKERSIQTLDHPWFSPGQPPVVLAVGRLEAQKDYPTLLHAFAKVHRTRPVRLVILGEGDARGEMEMLTRSLRIQEDVQLPGFIDNPYPCTEKIRSICAVSI